VKDKLGFSPTQIRTWYRSGEGLFHPRVHITTRSVRWKDHVLGLRVPQGVVLSNGHTRRGYGSAFRAAALTALPGSVVVVDTLARPWQSEVTYEALCQRIVRYNRWWAGKRTLETRRWARRLLLQVVVNVELYCQWTERPVAVEAVAARNNVLADTREFLDIIGVA
jgi:hypothetical protein